MPVIEDFNVSSKTRYVLWEITENYETLFSGLELDLKSKQMLSQKKSETHKNQFLAVRYLLKYLSIDLHNLNYNSLGNPFFENNYKISISHSGVYVAVIISDTDVGIDIETINDRILKIKSKFLETELNYPLELNTETSLVYWNIKESVFKAVDKPVIDFKKNILVPPLDMKKNVVRSWYIDDDKIYSFDTRFKISKKYTLAFVIKN
jgi:4'-phosphopantetheinyl transferase EntD